MPKKMLPWVLLLIYPQFVCMIAVTLRANKSVQAPCSGSLSLVCSIVSSSTEQLSRIAMFSMFTEEDELCRFADGEIHDKAQKTQCHYDNEKLTLTLRFLEARPSDHQTYYCKLRSNLGIAITNTTVLPPACVGSFEHTALENPSGEECLFYDVYPESQVLWFSDGNDVTAFSKDSKTLEGPNGLYNISSVFSTEKNMNNLSCRLSSHNSSYAIPSRPTPRQSPETGASTDLSSSNSSSCIGLHWLLFFTGLMLSQWE